MTEYKNMPKPPVGMPAHGDTHPLFVFCHGIFGCGTNVWFPYAQTVIADHDCDFISPDCPTPWEPHYEQWKETLWREIGNKWNKKQPIIFIGHSLGAYTLIRLLTDGRKASEEWAKNVKGFLFVAPVVSPALFPEGEMPWLTEADWDAFLTYKDITYKHIFCTNDIALGSAHSNLLRKRLTEANMKYECLELEKVDCDTHFGGLKHFPVKDINDRIIKIMKEVDPSL